MLCNNKLLVELSLVGKLATKLVLLFFVWVLNCLFKSPVRMDARQTVRGPEPVMFGIKVMQFTHSAVLSKARPEARSGHRLVTDLDGNLYSFGGYNNGLLNSKRLANDADWQRTKPLFAELWKYNVSTSEWIRLKTYGTFPKELASHSVELLDGELLISYGGTAVPFEACCSNYLYQCNLATDRTWSRVPYDRDNQPQWPTKKYGQALCLDNRSGKIYVSGGTDGFAFCIDVHWTKLWTCLESSPSVEVKPRYRHEMQLYENRLFLFGGGTSDLERDCELRTLPVFDLNSNTWTQCSTIGHKVSGGMKFPSKRRCHIICRYKDCVYMIGGQSKRRVCADLWKFDLRTKKWSLLVKQIPVAVFFHAACVSQYGELSYFGGLTRPGSNMRSKEMFSVWIDIPPLKEMAWRALLYYNDHLKNKSDAELKEFGLPFSYIRRLRN